MARCMQERRAACILTHCLIAVCLVLPCAADQVPADGVLGTPGIQLPSPTSHGYLAINETLGSAMFFAYYEAQLDDIPFAERPVLLWLQVRYYGHTLRICCSFH